MLKNPFFSAVIGLMLGLVIGYILAERQPVPPAKAMRPQPGAGHVESRMEETASGSESTHQDVEAEAARLRDLLANHPGDSELMRALGNLYFDASRWEEAGNWYEQLLEKDPDDVDVETDLAVVYRNIQQPERAITLLEKVVKQDPDHWQGWYNMVVVLHFDLHRHEDALRALEKLEALAGNHTSMPDISDLAAKIRSGSR